MTDLDRLRKFAAKPEINVKGFCEGTKELNYIHLMHVIKGRFPLTNRYFQKVLNHAQNIGQSI